MLLLPANTAMPVLGSFSVPMRNVFGAADDWVSDAPPARDGPEDGAQAENRPIPPTSSASARPNAPLPLPSSDVGMAYSRPCVRTPSYPDPPAMYSVRTCTPGRRD